MKAVIRVVSLVVISGCFFTSCTRDIGRLTPPPAVSCSSLNVTYAATIQPILLAHCATPACHASAGSAPGDYTQYSVVKFTVDGGLFQKRVFDDKDMPPSPLPDSIIQKLKCWVAAGAPNN